MPPRKSDRVCHPFHIKSVRRCLGAKCLMSLCPREIRWRPATRFWPRADAADCRDLLKSPSCLSLALRSHCPQRPLNRSNLGESIGLFYSMSAIRFGVRLSLFPRPSLVTKIGIQDIRVRPAVRPSVHAASNIVRRNLSGFLRRFASWYIG